MLSPEYLEEIEFNKVVDLYEKLNISIMADIIKRVSQMQEITVTSKEQLKILIQTNGIEIFNKALEEASMLRGETKNELKLMFEQMIKEDMEGYKKLYDYRNKDFKLSQTQHKILNQGFTQTNKTLKNFTNTIAFSSKQAYVQAVDEAYYKVASGAFNYATAISQASQKLADKGITLKDKAGRNVQLEVAIRRNIRWGIQETANKINRDIEEELGCNGYEVTAHVGARPTHAEEQGKQFALTKEDANKYNVGLWSDVEELWQEYNCRHSYFGIILGVSEPVYSDKELKDYKNATVNYNGKEIPYYEATQKQRAIENEIRKTTRSVKTLEKAGVDSSSQRADLRKLNKNLNSFLEETGLNKDYSRIKVAVDNNILTKEEQNAINKYISSDFYTINEKLRNNTKLSTMETELVKNLDSALDKLPVYTGLVRRSLNLDEDELRSFLQQHEVDKEVEYFAYTSTTSGERYNEKSQVELYIYSQNGKNMIKYNPDEKEVLYPRNSRFKVKEIDTVNNTRHILLEEINE